MRRNYECEVFRQARLECLKRDKRRCQMPGCKSKKRIQVHHIERWADSYSLRFELSNLICLCKECHDSIKDKELHYASLFRSILSGNS